MTGPETFRFLNEERTIGEPADWNDPHAKKLWLYNLHYFDDLNARDARARETWHRALMKRWIAENPPGQGNGWEAYPTSLRIVNWVKWALAGNELNTEAVQSLAVQARWLRRHLEYHLLGNHLLANAKALVFIGRFFDGAEAEEWRRKGHRLLERELGVQVLGDGGHFELSPMYHLIILEDLLDLINLERTVGHEAPQAWLDEAHRMQEWAAVMRHPDGDVPFFNDAAMGIAPVPRELDAYAQRQGLVDELSEASSAVLRDSGYVRIQRGVATLFVDVAKVGPDYLPGHAHADSLSFELSIGGRRLCVNAGTSTYEADALRAWQRGTSAHNTLRIDRENSSEMWAAFRVARRAEISVRTVEVEGAHTALEASHDGYHRLSGSPTHHRSYGLSDHRLIVDDQVAGHGEHEIETFLHIHPEIFVTKMDEMAAELRLRETGGLLASLQCYGDGVLTVEDSYWYPRFGQAVANHRCVFRQQRTQLPSNSGFTIDWAASQLVH